VVGEIAEHYLDGVPVKVAKKKSLRDILKNDGMEDQKFKFSMRSQNEIIALLGAGHVTGRTSFDKAYVTKWAFKSVYHFLNESLRDEFYEGEWDAGKADRHTIFLCQANYPVKGMHYVFEALPKIMEKYPDVKIRIAGDPITRHSTLKEKLKLQEYAKYLLKLEDEVAKKAGKAADIKYLGTLSASDIKEEYLKAGLFLCPSTIENSPNSLGEAMLLGLPCVAAKVGGVADMMSDAEGFLYTAGDTEGLAESICKVFSLSDADVTAIGKRGKERALKTHDRENNYRTLLEIYKSMVND
jgi:glycosyltransferase involved in cell wall biosynthesis